MPRFDIGGNARQVEMTDRYIIGGDGKVYEQMGRYRINPDTLALETIWERVVGYLFSASGRPLISASGRMLCTKSQLEK